ncbi:MAG: Type fimbrial assembly protein PilC [Oscillospiraceae bacterium]|nr:Type fimbrial assembly protein PilC [Oscillospiraceae bacterium]
MESTKAPKPAALPFDSLSILCYQLSLLCGAGIPSADSVAILAADTDDPQFRALLSRIRDGLDAGRPLSESLGAAGSFPSYLLDMISIGELSGRTEQVLAALSEYYEKESYVSRAARQAVTYPAIMGVIVSLIFLVLVIRVLPIFRQVFAQLGMTISGTAASLLVLGNGAVYIAGALSAIMSVIALLALLLFHLPGCAGLRGRLFSHGAVGTALSRSRFANAASLMFSSGMPLDELLTRTAGLLSDSPISSDILRCRDLMLDGMPFVKAVQTTRLLSGLDCGLLSAGVQAGASEEAMRQIALRSQTHADESLTALLSRLQYVMLYILCGGLALLLLSVMIPLLGVLSALGG